MRRLSLIPVAVLSVQLTCCSDQRPTGDQLQIADQKLDIPAACFGPPERPSTTGRVQADSVLIDLILPDATCPGIADPVPWKELPTETSAVAMLLVSPFGKGVRPARAHDAIFASVTSGSPNADTRSRAEVARFKGDRYLRYTTASGSYAEMKEAWRSKSDPSSFLICMRAFSKDDGSGRVRRCSHYFVYRGLSFKASYGRGWAPQWHDIEQQMKARFDDFSSNAAKSERSRAREP